MVIITDKFYRNAAIYTVLGAILITLIYQGVFFWKCPFVYFFGIECPGCGFTRALQNLMHGNFLEALSLNFLIVFVWVIPLYLILLLIDFIFGKTYLKGFFKLINNFVHKHEIKLIAISVIYWIFVMIYKNVVN